MLRVKRNTFPEYPGVAYAHPGDLVEWRAAGINRLELCRANDTSNFPKVLWSITRPNQQEDFKSGPIGVIAQNKGKGWVLELEEVQEVENV